MIQITSTIAIGEDEVEESFVRSPGPGGQNVNKVASAVQLRFDVARNTTLSPEVKARLGQLAGSRMTREGMLILSAHDHRSQDRNRQDALAKLIDLIRRATIVPAKRYKTKPSFGARQRRLESKGRRSKIKRLRGGAHDD